MEECKEESLDISLDHNQNNEKINDIKNINNNQVIEKNDD